VAASEEASYSTRCRRTRPGHTQCYRPHPELISSATTVVRKIDSWVLMPTPQAHHAGHGQRQVAINSANCALTIVVPAMGFNLNRSNSCSKTRANRASNPIATAYKTGNRLGEARGVLWK